MVFSRRKMKAVSLVFEQVLLFTAGIVIFMAMFYTFNVYQTYYMNAGAGDQIGQINDLVAGTIMELSTIPGDGQSAKTISIPARVSGMYYTISLDSYELRVATVDGRLSSRSDLYGLNGSFELSGEVSSNALKIIIYKTGDRIIIQ